jgi:hypothetical protein
MRIFYQQLYSDRVFSKWWRGRGDVPAQRLLNFSAAVPGLGEDSDCERWFIYEKIYCMGD